MLFINEIIPSFQTIHTYNEDHIIFKCKLSDLLHISSTKRLVNWKYNRPPDTVRCNEIAQHIYTKRPEIDWLFYMIYQNDLLHIIDGIHRFHSLQIIKRENSKPLDLLTPNIFGSNTNAHWLYEKYILVSLRINITEGQAIDLFQSLNKSNPVPELYMVDQNQQKRTTIEENVNEWMERFTTHFTASKNPNVPNMNRDRFIEILDFIYTKYEMSNSTSYILSEKLYELNNEIKQRPPKKISDNAMEKCNKTGCFLFLLRRDQLQERL